MTTWQEIAIDGRVWTLGPSLGSGGFGEVYTAESQGQWCAVKLVPKDPGAGRELLFADDLRGARNVLPVLGVGETARHWALLMPRAEQTLHQYLGEAGGPLHEDEALPVLIDIVQALVSLVAIGVVHRDLKPDNVLFYQGTWCLTDFGISRYADAVTERDTRKYSTTRPYAAPEQWRDETATAATDVYALGVLSHELLAGSLPFPGPEFRHQHLHEDPPVITTVAHALATLVEECLFKPPGARPTPQNLLGRLERQNTSSPASRGLASLQEVNLTAASHLARQAREQSQARTEAERREELYKTAGRQLDKISAELKAAVLSAAPTARPSHVELPSWQLALPAAAIRFSGVAPPDDRQREGSDYRGTRHLPFDVIACAHLAVAGRSRSQGHVGRAHSLWYCDAGQAGRYGWYETAFIDEARPVNDHYRSYVNYFLDIVFTDGIYIPYAANAREPKAARALKPSDVVYTDSCVVAWPFSLLEPGDLGAFIDRWSGWLAAASRGKLEEPTPADAARLPRSWRTAAPRPRPAVDTQKASPPQPGRQTRGLTGALGRLFGRVMGAPAPLPATGGTSTWEDHERGQILPDLDANPVLDWRPQAFVPASEPPRSFVLAEELVRGPDRLSRDGTEWARPLVETLRALLAERGEFEVVQVVGDFHRAITERLEQDAHQRLPEVDGYGVPLLEPLRKNERSTQILVVAKSVFDDGGHTLRAAGGRVSHLVSLLSSQVQIAHDPFDRGSAVWEERHNFATLVVDSGVWDSWDRR